MYNCYIGSKHPSTTNSTFVAEKWHYPSTHTAIFYYLLVKSAFPQQHASPLLRKMYHRIVKIRPWVWWDLHFGMPSNYILDKCHLYRLLGTCWRLSSFDKPSKWRLWSQLVSAMHKSCSMWPGLDVFTWSASLWPFPSALSVTLWKKRTSWDKQALLASGPCYEPFPVSLHFMFSSEPKMALAQAKDCRKWPSYLDHMHSLVVWFLYVLLSYQWGHEVPESSLIDSPGS